MSISESAKSKLSLRKKCGIALLAAVATSSLQAQAKSLSSANSDFSLNESQRIIDIDQSLVNQLVQVDPETQEVHINGSLFEKLHKEGLLKWEHSAVNGSDSTRACMKD